jgi:putative nucleotidyltransferase with HDIG domain
MNLNFREKKSKTWIKIGLFLLAIAIIVELFPHENRFNYHYSVGKPWHYEMMTAAFDFPIYKDVRQLQAEQDSALRQYTPFFRFNDKIQEEKLQALTRKGSILLSLPDAYRRYIHEQLTYVYGKGIMGVDDYNSMLKQRIATVALVRNNVAVNVPFPDVFNVKSAYQYILSHAGNLLNSRTLQTCNLNNYLAENLTFDQVVSGKARQDVLSSVSLTSGLVQTGERIIDRGDIVSDSTYRVLNSLGIATSQLQGGQSKSWLVLFGEVLMVAALMALLFLYVFLFRRREIFGRFKNVLFILMMIVAMIGASFGVIAYTSLSVYVVPFALLPVMICTFFDSRSALFAHIITILVVSFVVRSSPFEFIVLQIMAGMTVISSLRDLTQRSQLVQTAGLIFITYCVGYLGISLMLDHNLDKIIWKKFLLFGINSLSLLFAYAFIYIVEKTFGFLSNVTLIELSNVNNPLLVQFSEQAPGTFQHSLQVSNLATEAAQKIDANSLLVRTGALYHDIGKMVTPSYFTENQMDGVNPLQSMPDAEAAKIVINHVAEGVKLAGKHNLPWQIVQFIKTHHGAGKAKYFYQRFCQNHPGESFNENIFTYPGPKPRTKETAILMMADAVEAASRSLREYSEESISCLVDTIIHHQISEGAFSEAPITLRDIETVKLVFKEKLRNIYHSRIIYPTAPSEQ